MTVWRVILLLTFLAISVELVNAGYKKLQSHDGLRDIYHRLFSGRNDTE